MSAVARKPRTPVPDDGPIRVRVEYDVPWRLSLPREPLRFRIGEDTTLSLRQGEDVDAPTVTATICSTVSLDTAGNAPESPDAWLAGVMADLEDRTRRALRLMRWRFNIESAHDPIQSPGRVAWMGDGREWQPLDVAGPVAGDVAPPQRFDVSGIDEIDRLIADDAASEPLGHELFREAWGQREENPRSALIVGITSIEAGVKEFIRTLEPGTAWLVQNAPSPPLEMMLKRFVPLLIEQHGLRSLPASTPRQPIMEDVKDGVALRDRVVHGAPEQVDPATLERILLSIRDILWMLDVFLGRDWARDYVRPEVLEKWDPGNIDEDEET